MTIAIGQKGLDTEISILGKIALYVDVGRVGAGVGLADTELLEA